MPRKPQADPGYNCPIYKQDVSEVCHKCEWYFQLRGTHPQTGELLDQWACSVTQLSLLTLESAKAFREVAGEVNWLRKDVKDTAPIKLLEGLARAAPKQIT